MQGSYFFNWYCQYLFENVLAAALAAELAAAPLNVVLSLPLIPTNYVS
jgi:hypothetical protein